MPSFLPHVLTYPKRVAYFDILKRASEPTKIAKPGDAPVTKLPPINDNAQFDAVGRYEGLKSLNMEPLPKRQRIFEPAHRTSGQSFVDKHEYYDGTANNEIMDQEEDFEEEEESEEDPDTQLQHRRARLDYKLKSTFEAIFEKYGKDFDGLGDEIDLETGEIVVNNGHLTKMQDERDAGDTSKARRALRKFTAEAEDSPTSYLDTDMLEDEKEYEDIDEENEDDTESTTSDDGIDDGMILRGFAKANRFIQKPAELKAPNKSPPRKSRRKEHRQAGTRTKIMPSRSDILMQFGPELGPHIAKFVSQQQVPDSPVQDDSHIESAWRVPRIPFPKIHQPTKKPFKMVPEPERSPSPEAANSIWNQGRRIKHAQAPPRYYESLMLDPLSDPMGFCYDGTPMSTPKKIYQSFSPGDDQILLDFVEQARRQNLELGSLDTWVLLEEMHTRHSSHAWKKRYELKFTYLWPKDSEELESSETSVNSTPIIDQPNSVRSIVRPLPPARLYIQNRPSRVRKPAVKDPHIFSWSQAVHAIESVDPDLHAGILDDSRRKENVRRRSISSSFGQDSDFINMAPQYRQDNQLFPQYQTHPLPNAPSIGENSSNARTTKEFSCSQCFVTFKYQYELENHNHPECRFELPTSSDMGRHQTSHQSVLPRFPCIHCQQYLGPSSFKQEQHLHQHILKSHPNLNNCSHEKCEGLLSKVYNIQRQEGEDLSEMCLHLFHQHQVTPYPCDEFGCYRRGVEGFFTQIDLIRHFSISHASIGALERLRSLVDPKLFDHHIKLVRLPADDLRESQEQSNFASSAQNTTTRPTSDPRSSSSFGDRTMTPRMMNGTIREAKLTPTTTISSMVVHPASGSTALSIHNSQSATSFRTARREDHAEDRREPERQASKLDRHGTPTPVAPTQVFGTRQLSDPFRNDPVRRSLPTPQASLIRSVGPSSALPRQPVTRTPDVLAERHIRTRSRTRGSMPTTIPNSQSFTDTLPSNPFENVIPQAAPIPPGIPSTLLRPIDSSYAFSDEEDEPSVAKSAVAKDMPPERRLTRPVVEIHVKSTREPATEVESATIHSKPVQELPLQPSIITSRVVRPSAVVLKDIQPVAVEPMDFDSIDMGHIDDEPVDVEPVAVESVGVEPISAKTSKRKVGRSSINKLVLSNSSKATTIEPVNNSFSATIIKPIAMPQPTTPASRIPFQGRKSIALNADEDDFDELSSEQFDMFAHPRTNPQPKTNPILARVKHAGNHKSPQIHSAPSRKRKLDLFNKPKVAAKPAVITPRPIKKAAVRGVAGPLVVGSSRSGPNLPIKPAFQGEAGSLVAAGPAAASKVPLRAAFPVQEVLPMQPRVRPISKPMNKVILPVQELLPIDPAIKTEDNEPIILLAPASVPAPTTKKSRRLRNIPPGPSPMKSPFGRQLVSSTRTSTPLLDLTPSWRKEKRGFEIRDSDDEDSSPLTGVLRLTAVVRPKTPVMDRAWDQAAIVLRTPGGTFRKCGEDGFRCRKGFCFACGVEESVGKGKGKGKV